MPSLLATAEDIRQTAEKLATCLNGSHGGETGYDWTNKNFELLRNFCQESLDLDPTTDCFHKNHPNGKREFLWDFLAVKKERGVLLVAESEQYANSPSTEIDLKHDFEKLLYIYAPIRVLLCKSRDEEHRKRLLCGLTAYANGCCLNFNPGSVFLLHFDMRRNETAEALAGITYIWQSKGNPQKEIVLEDLCFKEFP
jgi:hypothetical protein